MQEFLNRSDDHLWGIVANGHQLRLLRDNASLTRTAYVEFDLRETFEGDAYSDFALLWLTCHASRLEGPAGKELLERWREAAATRGIRALDALRNGVESAIETLGSAAVANPDNVNLRQDLDSSTLDAQDLYRQILRVVYRFLFLFVAEGRDLLLDPTTKPATRTRYQRYYSITRLRDLAEATRGGLHSDLWRQHLTVAQALEATGEPELGLLPLGGFLWSSEATAALNNAVIPNEALLSAVRSLTMVRPPGELPQRVDYANLGAEELGSIYEALLEYIPEVNPVAGTFELKATAGNEKKTTGSYYTPTSLISEILNSALDPVLDDAARSDDPEQAILDLKVVDPAAGSGHFLIAAANRIADRLARVRAGDDEPSPDQLRTAIRDVIGRCIYAVDINPMAIELAKVALWIEAMEPGKPLTFIDHHVVCGNGIVGATPAMIIGGIPDGAFLAKPNEGDDRKSCTKHKNRNKEARAGQTSLFTADTQWRPVDRSADAARISSLPSDSLDDIAQKSRSWREFTSSADFIREKLMADAYCAAVTFPRTKDSASWMVAPYDVFYQLRDHPDSEIPGAAIERVHDQASRYRFLHWHLSFPEVFGSSHSGSEDDRCGWAGGFDVVLGNPPWDTLSPDRKEFFKAWLPQIASLSSKDQETAIEDALDASPQLRELWEEHHRDLFATSRFFRRSWRYRMFASGNLGKGDLNIYRAFVEMALTSVRNGGIASQITPSGIYAGANNAAIRKELLDRFRILVLWGFDNSSGVWFPGVGLKAFATYVAERNRPEPTFAAGFGIASIDDLRAAVESPFDYPVKMIRSIDDEALLIPEIRPGIDAHVVAKLIANRETFGQQNRDRGWHPYRRELDMGNDAHLFTRDPNGLPVYEGRMVDFYDHRAKAYISGAGRSSKWTPSLSSDSPDKRVAPQYFLPAQDVPAKLEDSWKRYRIGFLDVANPKSDARCLAAAVVPPDTVCGDKVPTISFEDGEEWRYCIWLATANSIAMDYIARKQIVLKVSFTVMDGLPFPVINPDSGVGRALIDNALRLTCVSEDMDGFRAQVIKSADLSHNHGTPPAIEEASRAQLRAEIDAIVARECFDLSRDEFEHILDDFTKLREREEKPPPKGLGEYRTKRLALEAFDKLSPDGPRGE
ncbi:MAG: N-6 DNA methylase [Acidimicrobiia bacterium]|nr:N-6 DNA methylase [Acidimicrobiia bacterium]